MAARFPFNDLHSFKDYVGFVQLCCPDLFPDREGVRADDKWTLELAFAGLREGLRRAVEEKGDRPAFRLCETLVESAFEAYRNGSIKEGADKLGEVRTLLRQIPTG